MRTFLISKMRRPILGALVAIPFALAALGTMAKAQDLTSVTLRLDSFYYGAHVPMLLGIVDGTYKKYGLDVKALEGRGSANTIQTVAAGSDEFGFADGGTLVKFAARGLKAKQIVGILQVNPSVIVTFPEEGVKVPADLEGLTGAFGVGSAPEVLFPAFVNATGIDVSSINKVSTTYTARDNLFLAKEVDFAFGYSIMQPILMEERCGCKIDVLRYSDYGITAISNGIIVSDSYAAEHPEIVEAFAKATVESIRKAVANPEKALDAFMSYAENTQYSRDAVSKMWKETIVLLHTENTKGHSYGVTSAEDWEKTITTLEKFAEVPKGAVTPSDVATNRFIKAAK